MKLKKIGIKKDFFKKNQCQFELILHNLDLGYETVMTVLEKKNIMKHNFQ
jgi:hypothetical protein